MLAQHGAGADRFARKIPAILICDIMRSWWLSANPFGGTINVISNQSVVEK
jgi:hypothetical protein